MTNQDVIKDHQLTINAFGMHSLGSFRYYWQHLLWKIDFFQSMFRKPIKTKFALHGLFFQETVNNAFKGCIFFVGLTFRSARWHCLAV